MTEGFDTGFFVALFAKAPEALGVWQRVEAGEAQGVISCVSLYELARLGLRGALPKRAADVLRRELPAVCAVVWLGQGGEGLLEQAARTAHGHGLAMADALILTSLVSRGAKRIYTSDKDLLGYPHGPEMVRVWEAA